MKTHFKITASPLFEYEQPFQKNNNGWLGGDCAFSLPLSKEKVLWLFGDSFVNNKVTAKLDRKNAEFINNSIAVQKGNLIKKEYPLQFFWHREQENDQAFFNQKNEQGFLWAISGIQVQNRFFIFAVRIFNKNPEQALGFQQIGNEIVEIRNPQDTPSKWKMIYHKLRWEQRFGSFGSTAMWWEDYLYIYGYQHVGKKWLNCIRERYKPNHKIRRI